MPYQRRFGDDHLKIVDQPLCQHFRSRSMYSTGQLDAFNVDNRERFDEQCWCNLTQRSIGPDTAIARLGTCIPGRECFQSR